MNRAAHSFAGSWWLPLVVVLMAADGRSVQQDPSAQRDRTGPVHAGVNAWVAELLAADPRGAHARYRQLSEDPQLPGAERALARARAGELAGWLGLPGEAMTPSARRLDLLRRERETPGSLLDPVAAEDPDAPWAPWVDRTAATVWLAGAAQDRNRGRNPNLFTPPPKALLRALELWARGDQGPAERILRLMRGGPGWGEEPILVAGVPADAAAVGIMARLEASSWSDQAPFQWLDQHVRDLVSAGEGATAVALLWQLPLPASITGGYFGQK